MRKYLPKKTNKIIGLIYIFIGLFLIITNGITVYANYSKEQKMLSDFYQKENSINKQVDYDKYVSIIKIPKINLEKGLFSKSSKYNNIEYNVMIHENSDTPLVENGNVILLAHSGTSEVSFFKNLNKLEKNDITEIYYQGLKYNYKVVNIYEVEKTGKVEINRNIDKNTLTMITCKHNTNKQIVVISELDSVTNY